MQSIPVPSLPQLALTVPQKFEIEINGESIETFVDASLLSGTSSGLVIIRIKDKDKDCGAVLLNIPG